jgi:3-hydroxyisobutyrate dehydrogenase-like beta-hydroxyacid dehydrogenase
MSSEHVTLPANIGFIGLGNMGWPMAKNLAKTLPPTYKVHIYDVSDEAMERALNEPGLEAVFQKCSSSREVAERSVRIISLLQETGQ